MKKIKVFLVTVLAFVIIGAIAVTPVLAAPEGSTTITILHTNDIHGRFVVTDSVIGFDTVAAIRETTPNSILVDAGDTIHGLPFVTFNQGVNAIELMNAAGYSLFVPGNHDFNYGIDWLLQMEAAAEFGFIAANLIWEADGSSVFAQYNIIEVDGVRVGFFGLALPETPTVTNPEGVVGLSFTNPIEAAQRSVAALQAADADVIIALAHLGLDGEGWGREVALAVQEIDVIIDGHSHTRLDEGLMYGDVLVAQAGAHGAFVGSVEIVVYNGEVISREASLITREMADEFSPVSEITDVIAQMTAELDELLDVVVAYSPVTMFGDDPEHRPALRSGEVPVGNLFADAMRREAGTQIAMMNSGGIRYHLHAGPVTKHDMYRLHSFSNYVVAVEMTPAVLFETLDVGISQHGHGRFPQVGGFSFVYDNDRPEGERILSVTLADGTELSRTDTTTTIRTAISSFMSVGGDDYTMLVDLPRIGEFGILQDVLADFIEYADLTTIGVEGRIVQGRDVNGAVFVGVRDTAQARGYEVEWDDSRRAVILTDGAGNSWYIVIGDQNSFIEEGRFFAPADIFN